MYAFIRNLVGVKTDQAVNGAVEAIVRWDPKSATEAELRTMEQHLDVLGRQVAEARMAFDKEKREADTIQTLSQQRMAAAEQYAAPDGGGDRPSPQGRAGAQPRHAGLDAGADGAGCGPREAGRGGCGGVPALAGGHVSAGGAEAEVGTRRSEPGATRHGAGRTAALDGGTAVGGGAPGGGAVECHQWAERGAEGRCRTTRRATWRRPRRRTPRRSC